MDDDRDAPESMSMEAYPDGFVSSFFETDDDKIVVELAPRSSDVAPK